MNEKVLKYLYDIKIAIGEIDSFFENEPRNFDNYRQNPLLKRAIERNLEIIGEAMNRILLEDITSLLKIQKGSLASGIKLSMVMIPFPTRIWGIINLLIPKLKKEVNSYLKYIQ